MLASNGIRRSRRSSSCSTSMALGWWRSTPESPSSTTCWRSSESTGSWTSTVRTKGDVEVDAHHTVEDTSLAVGQALREALGDKAGVRRFGHAVVPLDETRVLASVDLSGRPYLVHSEPELVELIGSYDTTLDPTHLGVDRRRGTDHSARRGADRPQCPPRCRGPVQGRGQSAAEMRWHSTRASPGCRPPRERWVDELGAASPASGAGRVLLRWRVRALLAAEAAVGGGPGGRTGCAVLGRRVALPVSAP